jgi:hypothetical protein
MSTFTFWHKWLLVVSLMIAAFGVMMALLSGTPLFDLFNNQIDPAFWGASASAALVGEAARRFQQWLYGVWGATVAGWGITLAYVARYPFRRKERWVWNGLVAGLLVWFVLDTALSALYGVYFNVAFNVALIVLAGLPVVFTRKEFN